LETTLKNAFKYRQATRALEEKHYYEIEEKNKKLKQAYETEKGLRHDLEEAQEREKRLQLIAANRAFNLGVKHELNQDLATLNTSLFMHFNSPSVRNIVDGDDFQKSIKKAISSSIKSITEKVSYMKDGEEKLPMEKVNLYDVVMEVSKKYSDRIKFNIDVPKDLSVYWSKRSAYLVLDNLLKNSDEALVEKNDKIVDIYGSSNESVVLCVKDYGCGMDEKTKNEAFIPGKSTKGVGENSRHRGEGLFFVLNSIYAANGDIHLDSKIGEYTEFKLVFSSGK